MCPDIVRETIREISRYGARHEFSWALLRFRTPVAGTPGFNTKPAENPENGKFSGGWDAILFRGERTWAIATQTVLREPKFRTEFPYFFKGKTTRILKKEGFTWTPSNRYGPNSSRSNSPGRPTRQKLRYKNHIQIPWGITAPNSSKTILRCILFCIRLGTDGAPSPWDFEVECCDKIPQNNDKLPPNRD